MPDSPSSDDGLGASALFQEPADYWRPEAQPTAVQYTLRSGQQLTLRLVGHNPLWAHHLWNGGRVLAAHLEQHAASLVQGRRVLELGAGAGLPGLVAALHGAKEVFITDYPDAELVENLGVNIGSARGGHHAMAPAQALGYLWGAQLPAALGPEGSFDLLLLADLLFNHSEHGKLADTVARTLSRSAAEAVALVFFTPYRPWLLDKDLDFFNVVRERGLRVAKVFEQKMETVMFEQDPGDEEIRRTVFGYEVKWARQEQTVQRTESKGVH